MGYSNSNLVNYTRLSPNHSGQRNHIIDTVTVHCVVGQCSVETIGSIFADSNREASSNYGIGYDGRIGMYVEEKNRSWCSSSAYNDNRAITIEVASDTYDPYRVNDAAYRSLVLLLADICRRNGIKKLVWSTSKNDRVNHLNGCNMTVHRDYANKSCPGDYLYNRHGQIAKEVNALLGSSSSAQTTTSGNDDTSVITVQKWLNKVYKLNLDVDGIYGPATKKAIIVGLQRVLNQKFKANLAIDGVFGEKTKAAVRNLSKGAKGGYPSILQAFLICRGYDTGGFDGDFGNQTENAVKQFQRDHNLFVDGIAGKETFSKLAE